MEEKKNNSNNIFETSNNPNPDNHITAYDILIYKDVPSNGIKLEVRGKWVEIPECPQGLKSLLKDKFGAGEGRTWNCELTYGLGEEPILPRVISVVHRWLGEQD